MSKLIVKDNALINASYTLDLAEQRLILLAITEARETGKGITENSLLEVHASSYINCFHVDRSTAYRSLKEASKGLFDRYVTYHDTNPKNGRDRSFHCRWVDKIGYEDLSGIVYIRFTQDVVPLITRLEENFTKYELEQIANLSSTYATRIYELLIQWRTIGSTPVLELEKFRNQLGLKAHEYKLMSDFKKRVLDIAIKQINEHTDITVTYEQQKKGRTITGFSFSFKHKKNKAVATNKKEKKAPDLFCKLTDAQINKYSSVLAKLPELSDLSNFPDYPSFALYISNILKDPKSTKNTQTAERIFKALHEKTDFKV